MEYAVRDLFPQLDRKLDPIMYSISPSDIENNTYFMQLVDNVIEEYGQEYLKSKKSMSQLPFQIKDVHEFRDLKTIIGKIMPKLAPVRVPKGTVVYTIGAAPDQGYFLMHGCVQLLAKKNNWQRLESYPGHTLFNIEERVEYLNNSFGINPKHFDVLESLFYEDKMSFNFLPFHKIYSGEYFGFKELLRSCMRTKVAIATEDSLLVKIRRQDFDKYLKDFQEKRQQYMINCMFNGVKSEIAEDILHRIPIAFNFSELVTFEKDDVIFKEGELTNGVYLLLSGEVVESKDVRLEVPKKYLTNQNQKEIVKQVTIRLHKLVKNAFVGQIQPLLSSKHRQFTCKAGLNSTLLLKFDSTTFLKIISESNSYEKQLILASKHRFSVATDQYFKQKKQITTSYLKQFQEFDHKKKQKKIQVMINNQSNFKQNALYELFKRQGSFYRDTFQRLEGFESFQARHDPKRSSIHRHKIESYIEESPRSPNLKLANKYATKNMPIAEEKSFMEEGDLSFEATKKILMSPGKTSNQFEVLGPEIVQKLSPVSEYTEGSRRKKKRTVVPKFQELKKDQTVFKRVLIRNGRYEVPRETNTQNRVEAIVNHKFDEVVKQCMTRKSTVLKKALVDNRRDLLKDQFRKTLTSMPKKSSSMTRFSSASVGYTCKGTDEMRKKLQKLKWFKGSPGSSGQKVNDDPKLQECIGFNRQPMSSELKNRSSISPSKYVSTQNLSKTPERIVLLNHMMKPITYTSTQM